jgi:hypothetical protein
MFWMNLINTLDDVKRWHPDAVLPGDEEPAWLRRQAEQARELPLLRAERSPRNGESRWAGLFARLWLFSRSQAE